MKAAILILAMIIIYGCAIQKTAPTVQPPPDRPAVQPAEQTAPVAEPPFPAESQDPIAPQACQSDLEPHQIRHLQVSLFEEGLEETEDGFRFRVLPTDEEGNIVPTEGTVSVAVFSSKEDEPLKREYSLFRKSFHMKRDDVLPDCGPAPVEIKWEDLRASSNMRYMTLPNPGILTIEFTRTGSRELWEAEYKGAEHDVDLVR